MKTVLAFDLNSPLHAVNILAGHYPTTGNWPHRVGNFSDRQHKPRLGGAAQWPLSTGLGCPPHCNINLPRPADTIAGSTAPRYLTGQQQHERSPI